MFSDFKKELLPFEQQTKIPQDRLKAILPPSFLAAGLTYKEYDGNLILSPSGPGNKLQVTFKGETYDNIIEQIIDQNPELEHVRDQITPDNLNKVLYRTQTTLTFERDTPIYLNNQEMKVDDLRTGRGLKGDDSIQIKALAPKKDTFLTFEFGGESIDLGLKPIPMHTDELLHLYVLQSPSDKVLQLTIKIPDEKNKSFNLTFNINLAKAKNVKEIVDLKPLLENVISGKEIKINGKDLGLKSEGFPQLTPLRVSLEEYEKLLEIEQYYNVTFGVNKNFTDSDISKIDSLYDTVIQDNKYAELNIVDKIWNVSGAVIKDDAVGKLVNVAIPQQNENLTILGVSIPKLNSIKLLYQFKVESVSDEGAKLKATKYSSFLIKFLKKNEGTDDFSEISLEMLRDKAKSASE